MLLGLGLFIAGVVTGGTVLYWGCVAVCVVAAVLLVLVRRQTGAAKPEPGKAPRPAETPPADSPPAEQEAPAASAHAPVREPAAEPVERPDPGVEEVEVTDLLLVVDLTDEVLVVDEHPRYHLAGCAWLAGRETIPLPLDEARSDGFTPCAVCSPDRNLAERARAAKHATEG